MFKYFPHTEEDIQLMMQKIGINKTSEMFVDVPKDLLFKGNYNIPSSHSELEIRENIDRIARKNKELISFLGAGAYDVYVPSVISSITQRQEFLTSYTPYQPEISQGTLQYIFEFQSMICELTGLDVANASLYDGATATAEAMFMAASHSRKNKVLVSNTVNPYTLDVVLTYAKYRGIEVVIIEEEDKVININKLKDNLDDDTAAVIVQYPNYYGYIEDYSEIKGLLNEKQLFIMNVDPSVISVLKSPQEFEADIAVGEGQTLGIPLSFGGPYIGFIAAKEKLLRKMPGRICGMTTDVDGNRGFVLTLQAREQHIRREKANSNICSNQSLMALHTVIYMSLLGKQGLAEVNKRAYSKAHLLYDKLLSTGKFSKVTDKPFFKEFVLKYYGDAKILNDTLLDKGYLSGLILDNNELLFCVTEKRTFEEIDEFVRLISEVDHE